MENEGNSSTPNQESSKNPSPQEEQEHNTTNNNNNNNNLNQTEMPLEENKKHSVRPINFHLPPPSPEMEISQDSVHPSSDPTSLMKHKHPNTNPNYDTTPQTLKVRKLGQSFHEDMDAAASSPYSSPTIPLKTTPRPKFPLQAHTIESHSLPQTPLYHPPQNSIATPTTLAASLSNITSPPAAFAPSPSIVVSHPTSFSAPVTPYKNDIEVNLPKPDQTLWESRNEFTLKIKRENIFSSVPSSPSKPRVTPAKRKLIAQSPDVRDFNIAHAKNIKYFSDNTTTIPSPMEGSESTTPLNFGESPQKARFETVRRLGTGTEAEVFEVKDKKNDKRYALKIARKPGTLKSAENESRIGTGMQNSHCVRYITSWSEDACIHIIMELCTKGSLDSQPAPSQQDLWRYTNEIAQGLHYMHNTKKLVHLDIKPSNIMVSESGELKIGDFGTAVDVGSVLNSYSHLDFQYIAPELADVGSSSKSVQVFPAADVFSFGLVLFELATNIKVPQKNQEQEVQLWNKVRAHDAVLSTTLERNNIHPTSLLGSTILRMLDPNPESRITIQELIEISQTQLTNVTNNNNQ